MANWASVQDITDRWVGSNVPTNTEQIEAFIDDAEMVILSEFPLIQGRVDNNTLNVKTIIFVVSRMVIRYIKNPEGLTYLQQNTGPFGQGQTYGADKDIFLTEKERQLLAPNGNGKARSISLLDGSRKVYTDYQALYTFLNDDDEIEWYNNSDLDD